MRDRAEIESTSQRGSTADVSRRVRPSASTEAEAERVADELSPNVRQSKPLGPLADAPLPDPLRQDMEQRFDHDFSKVRVHADAAAADSARAVNAMAYTVGNDVVFGAGRFAPQTPEGTRLVAHELAHVVQQSETSPRLQRKPDLRGGNSNPLGGEQLRAPVAANFDNFGHGSAALKPEHGAMVQSLSELYFRIGTEHPGTVLVLTGHTDLTGDERDNVTLGRRRAVEVAAAVTRLGVPTAFVRIESAGETEPVVDTPEREPRNRRVEARFEPASSALQTSPPTPFNPMDTSKWRGLPPRPPIIPPEPPPVVVPPTPAVPTQQSAQPAPGIQEPGLTRPGDVDDIFAAIQAQDPRVKAKVDELKKLPESVVGKMKPGDKIASVPVAGGILAAAIAAVIKNPDARQSARDRLDGLEVKVPGAEWLKVQFKTKDPGGVVTVDIIKLVGGK
jgi:outer membrane protein OmpA-like peptidoglycan-associated protein